MTTQGTDSSTTEVAIRDAAAQATRRTPPTSPIPIAVRRRARSVWPPVLGTVCIFLGVFGLAGSLLSVGGLLWTGAAATGGPAWYQWMSTAIGGALSLLLIVGGAALVCRSRRGVTLTRVYAFAQIPWALIGPVVGAFFMSNGGMPRWMVMFGLLIGLTLSLAWPIFLLVWYARAPVRDEIALWERRTNAG